MAQDNLQNIMTGFDGTMAMIAKTADVYGGAPGKVFAASFSVVNGTITGVVSFEGSAQTQIDLEKAVIGVGAGYFLADVLATGIIELALGALLTPAAAAASPVLIVGAGAAAIIAGIYGDDIYNIYTDAQNAFLKWLADDNVSFDTSFDRFLFLEGADFIEDILPDFSSNTGHTENFSSPLVLDLNGNGTTSTFIAQTNTYFDMDGDGFRERTSWAESSDGLLTLDLNNDGKVTNGSELFGNNTKLSNGTTAKDGFEALSQYDLNHDNVIDSKDSIYAHLKVWMDTNSDGISTNDELKTLQELNITSINLNATETSTSEAYNQISDTSTFTQDGQTKILFTYKHFTTSKSLHVRNQIQHKGAQRGEENKVA